MKNLKNMVAATCLMAVLGFGAVSANAGLIVSDRCAAPATTLAEDIGGIILVAFPMVDGLIVSDRTGLIVSDKSAGCQNDGVIMSDRGGLIVSD